MSDDNDQVPYSGPPRAMIMLVDNPETQSIELQCATEPSYDPKHPSHAIARYIGDHLHEITQLVKVARIGGALPAGALPGTTDEPNG